MTLSVFKCSDLQFRPFTEVFRSKISCIVTHQLRGRKIGQDRGDTFIRNVGISPTDAAV
jgi:hypothetical protein